MNSDPIEILFDDESTVRILRYLLVHSHTAFTTKKLSTELKLQTRVITKILKRLLKTGLVKKGKQKSNVIYRLQSDSSLVKPLRELLQFNIDESKKDLKKSFKNAGQVKTLIFSGILTGNDRSQVDVVVVGDKLNVTELRKQLRQLGYKTGYDLRYVQLNSEEYSYRKEMNDRLLRNVLDFEHEIII